MINSKSPLSVFDATKRDNVLRARYWDSKFDSTVGRDAGITFSKDFINNGISKYNAAQCEALYEWYACKDGANIFDPFAGGCVRGLVAACLGHNYVGLDVRAEQVAANYAEAERLGIDNVPIWVTGDSTADILNNVMPNSIDFIQTSPPYYNLEIYSNLDNDLSNLSTYAEFLAQLDCVIRDCGVALKGGHFSAWTTGNFRDEKGYMVDFTGDVIRIHEKHGMRLYNEMVLVTNSYGQTYAKNRFAKSKKVIKNHQDILIFKKI